MFMDPETNQWDDNQCKDEHSGHIEQIRSGKFKFLKYPCQQQQGHGQAAGVKQ